MIIRPPDRTSPIPLYFQIAEEFAGAIRSGRIAPGERLDNELELAEQLGVSRPTVRQAILRLVQEDLVVRRRGVGTVVVTPRVLRPVALTSLYDDLAAAGQRPATAVLAAAQIEADDEIAASLALAIGSRVWSLVRLRSADGAPLAIMHNYLPADLLPDRPEEMLEKGGLYELLRKRGVQLHAADQVLAARRATASEARLLHAPRGATVLTVTRTAFDPTGTPVEYGRHACLADRYSFRMSLPPGKAAGARRARRSTSEIAALLAPG
jgi:GntR family transcriptional regulator